MLDNSSTIVLVIVEAEMEIAEVVVVEEVIVLEEVIMLGLVVLKVVISGNRSSS